MQDRAVGFKTESDAWAWQPEAVVIAAPASEHGHLLFDCAVRKVPVLVEKPLARAAHEIGEPADYAIPIHIGCNWRFHPLVCELRKRMEVTADAVPLGALFWVLSDAKRKHPERQYEDALLECGAHEIDLALYLLGPAVLHHAEKEGTIWRVDLRHENGCATTIAMDDSSEQRARGLRISWSSWEGGYSVPYDDPRSDDATEASYARELYYFLECAAGKTPPDYGAMPAMLSDGLDVLKICDAARTLSR
jgi:predicted dehydrogenase